MLSVGGELADWCFRIEELSAYIVGADYDVAYGGHAARSHLTCARRACTQPRRELAERILTPSAAHRTVVFRSMRVNKFPFAALMHFLLPSLSLSDE